MKSTSISEKEMQVHRNYMNKSKRDSMDLSDIKYQDYYQLLGVQRDAPHTEIKSAYRKMALLYHPDRNSSQEAAQRWEGVPAAYAVISNPNERTAYDATLPTRDALYEFYRAYNPAKLDNATIGTIIDGWSGREVELFEMLRVKYEVAPHQGVDKTAKRELDLQSISLTEKIVSDSVTNDPIPGPQSVKSNTSSFGLALCCAPTLKRIFFRTYYEVDTESPGISRFRTHSETPGQFQVLDKNGPGSDESSAQKLANDRKLTCSTTDEELDSNNSYSGEDDASPTNPIPHEL